MKNAFKLIKESYIKKNPNILIDEENPRSPHYLSLVDIHKEILDDKPPEYYFGDEYFLFQARDDQVQIGFHLKSLNGRRNNLYSILVSSASLVNADIYKNATKILGNFSGYVYSTAIGNMRVCPPPLSEVNDLFM